MRNEDPYLADYIKDKIQRTADTKASLTTKTGVTDKRKDYKRQVQSLGHTGSIAQGDIYLEKRLIQKGIQQSL